MKKIIAFFAEHSMGIMPLAGAGFLMMAALLVLCPEAALQIMRWTGAGISFGVGAWLISAYSRYLRMR